MELGPIPLVALNAPTELSNECLILGGKPTSKISAVTLFFDPERTFPTAASRKAAMSHGADPSLSSAVSSNES